MSMGKIKIWFERARMWIGIANFGMIFYLFITQQDIGTPVMIALGLLLGLTVITILDIKFIMPKELAWSLLYNPEWIELKRVVEEIRDEVKKK